MKVITKFLNIGLMLCVMLMLQGCPPETPTFKTNDFDFKAVNLSAVSDKAVTANGGTPVECNWTFTITVNGESETITVHSVSNELPVMPGNEIEVKYTPSHSDEISVITLPDGTQFHPTKSAPSIKWTVPADLSSEARITGETKYSTEDANYEETGMIKLKPIVVDKSASTTAAIAGI